MHEQGNAPLTSHVSPDTKRIAHEAKIVVAGNHDRFVADHPVDARAAIADAGGIYLEDEPATIDGARFYGSPWHSCFLAVQR